MQTETIKELALNALNALKAQDVQVIDISDTSSIADYMIIATGTSSRHIQSMADNVAKEAKIQKLAPKVEGKVPDEWILIDLGDVIVHSMLQSAREFYCLEKLWVPLKQK